MESRFSENVKTLWPHDFQARTKTKVQLGECEIRLQKAGLLRSRSRKTLDGPKANSPISCEIGYENASTRLTNSASPALHSLVVEVDKAVCGDGIASLRHQPLIIGKVMQRQQNRPQHLFGPEQMPQISSAQMAVWGVDCLLYTSDAADE